ncbi:MAG: nitrous oxide reductase accessory protein NosL [Armatimonadota bacterium]|nr:nitrous oxide reductase accessory protein NosL [Armatimonadota bacterium]MDR5702490.1 nitrous oxide reductase accessory protein NosL [Armatimonadota bacterium]MDR7433588.1 nitrous oxide reductase accessory protein NosL [Armatimonadota bacterium]
MRRVYPLILAFAVAIGLVITFSYLRERSGEVKPKQILLGVETCAECGMVIREEPHAAELVTEEGVAKFCDIGCMLLYRVKHHPQGEGVRAMFVHDWTTKQWIRAEGAFYVRASLYTPMYYGLFAFHSREEAERFAGEGAKIWTFHEALEFVRRQGEGSE